MKKILTSLPAKLLLGIIVGIVIGMICAFDGLRSSLRAMERMSRNDEKKPFAGFNDHE